MKNFVFATNIVRTSYSPSVLVIIIGLRLFLGPYFLFVDEYPKFCLVSGASYFIRIIPLKRNDDVLGIFFKLSLPIIKRSLSLE